LAIGGAALAVRLTPKSGCDAIDGVQEFGDGRPALMVRVRAAPADGEANADRGAGENCVPALSLVRVRSAGGH